ncbi:hypothetical protein [Streptomyces sp. ITFR-6]|uniref:hypothetical protein n=1 Tax=Streptomyces sp. ITFR-6 TaxID=3075197 RepID=UPI00288C0348|nr:hypothetical protein [Streptomyces sp. ITFR-6]WNI28774.1 hypothetical protein RLT59_08230 [Streptomyces sp. ITFR-6]
MIGAPSRMSVVPFGPASTGQHLFCRQRPAASAAVAGGSSRETNSASCARSSRCAPISEARIAASLVAAGSGCSLRTATERRVYPSSTTLSVRIPTVSGSRRRTIRPTTTPSASVSGSLSSPPGTSWTVSTGSPSGSAASTTSRSTASSQDSTSTPSTVSRSTGSSAPSASRARTSRTWSWRKRRCTVTEAGPSCGAIRT